MMAAWILCWLYFVEQFAIFANGLVRTRTSFSLRLQMLANVPAIRVPIVEHVSAVSISSLVPVLPGSREPHANKVKLLS